MVFSCTSIPDCSATTTFWILWPGCHSRRKESDHTTYRRGATDTDGYICFAGDGGAQEITTTGVVRITRETTKVRTHVDNLDISRDSTRLLPVLPVEDSTTILVELDGGDNDIGRVNANGGACAVRLVTLDTVDVDDPLLAVDLDDLALTTLVLSTDNSDLIILANG